MLVHVITSFKMVRICYLLVEYEEIEYGEMEYGELFHK